MENLDEQNLTFITELTRTAYEYGPFLFAIVFLLTAWQAHRSYRKVFERKDPTAKAGEIKSLQWFYLATAWSGLVLVAISVLWWLFVHFPGQSHIVQFRVLSVDAEAEILTPREEAVYWKIIPYGENKPNFADYYFLVAMKSGEGPDHIILFYENKNIVDPEFDGIISSETLGLDGKAFKIVFTPNKTVELAEQK